MNEFIVFIMSQIKVNQAILIKLDNLSMKINDFIIEFRQDISIIKEYLLSKRYVSKKDIQLLFPQTFFDEYDNIISINIPKLICNEYKRYQKHLKKRKYKKDENKKKKKK